MRRYLLDTNAVGDWMNRRYGVDVRVREARLRGDVIGTCEPVVAELYFGVENSATRDENLVRLRRALAGLKCWPLSRTVSQEFGRLMAALKREGRPTGTMDVLIAAIGLISTGTVCVLVGLIDFPALILVVLLACEVPVAFALGASGVIGLVLLDGFALAHATLGRLPFQSTSRYALIIVPMFVLMGLLAMHGGIADDVFRLGDRMLRRLPGGLGLATIFACGCFAAVSGSSVATVATVGRTSVTKMRNYGYDATFAAGIVGAAGTLGVLIPPSVVLVLYGIITGESIGQLLVAGIVPGLLSALLYAVTVSLRVRLRPQLIRHHALDTAMAGGGGDRPPANDTAAPPPGLRHTLPGVVRIGVIFTVVVGGIYTGVVTATESAALGGFVALLLTLPRLVRSDTRVRLTLAVAARDAATVTSMIFAILIGAGLFTFFLVRAGVPTSFTRWVLALDVPPLLIVLLLLTMMIPLGMALDPVSILLISVPLAHPVVTGLGFDGIWFAILTVKMIELGLITPPVGLNAYVLAGSIDGVNVEQAFRGLGPFFAVDVVTVAILVAVPGLVLWLPGTLG
jgi:C4-dicarboxylate transporter, DctM subunit